MSPYPANENMAGGAFPPPPPTMALRPGRHEKESVTRPEGGPKEASGGAEMDAEPPMPGAADAPEEDAKAAKFLEQSADVEPTVVRGMDHIRDVYRSMLALRDTSTSMQAMRTRGESL